MGLELREIAKVPRCPALTDREIEKVRDLCFAEYEGEYDCLFVFGTSSNYQQFANILHSLSSESRQFSIVLTGGSPTYEQECTLDGITKSEADVLAAHLSPNVLERVRFVESRSRNTLENVLFALDGIRTVGAEKIAIMGQAHAMRRCELTAKQFFGPKNVAATVPVAIDAYGAALHRDRWHMNEQHRQMVWGEVVRLYHYGRRGDFSLGVWAEQVEAIVLGADVRAGVGETELGLDR